MNQRGCHPGGRGIQEGREKERNLNFVQTYTLRWHPNVHVQVYLTLTL